MRVLFFLEPVIFRNSPSLISAHFLWVDYFRRACEKEGWQFALTANESTCKNWSDAHPDATGAVTLYEINPFETLAAFNHERRSYAKAAYSQSEESNPLLERLIDIRKLYAPTLIVMSSQNSFAQRAFAGIAILSIEQAPLPRLGHPMRTAFDPIGHQTKSLLETSADEISSLPLTAQVRREAMSLLSAIKQTAHIADARGVQVVAALDEFRREGPVALLVTQPTDAVTYEGAYQPIELENLLYAWAQALPPGWIGVPTYHGGQRLTEDMEAALAAATNRLRFLPQTLSLGLSEPMLLSADGMVTISSTSAMTGLLFQKRVIVTGRSPYNTWCLSDPARIAEAPVLSDEQVASVLCFLTNRLTLSHEVLDKTIDPLIDLVKAVTTSGDPVKWLTDISEWTPERAAQLFRFRGCVKDTRDGLQGCLREQLERQLGETLAQSNVFESEWKAAVTDRDRVNQKLADVAFERDALRAELTAAISERENLQRESAAKSFELESLSNSAAATGERLNGLVAAITAERNLLGEKLGTSHKDRESDALAFATKGAEWDVRWSVAAADREQLREQLTKLVGERDTVQADALILQQNREALCRELADKTAEFEEERIIYMAECNQLREQIATWIGEHDKIRTEAIAAANESARLSLELSEAVFEREKLSVAQIALCEHHQQQQETLTAEVARGDDLRTKNQQFSEKHAHFVKDLADRKAEIERLRVASAEEAKQHSAAAAEIACLARELATAKMKVATLTEQHDKLKQELDVESARGDSARAESDIRASELERQSRSLEQATQQYSIACAELTGSLEQRDSLNAQLRSYIDWTKTYRLSIASLPLWRLAMHYKKIATEEDQLGLPKEPT